MVGWKHERERMNSALKSIVVPELRKLRFKGSFPHFKRATDKLELLSFQFSNWGEQFVIEIGRCPLTGVTYANNTKIPPEKVKAYHTLPPKRYRLPPKSEAFQKQWFNYEKGAYDKIAKEVVDVIKALALPWLSQ